MEYDDNDDKDDDDDEVDDESDDTEHVSLLLDDVEWDNCVCVVAKNEARSTEEDNDVVVKIVGDGNAFTTTGIRLR